VAVAALAAIAVALAAVGGWLFYTWETDRAEAKAGPQALKVAAAAMPFLISYNYKTLDTDFAKAETYISDFGHGNDKTTFKTDYKKTVEKSVRDAATRYKVVVKADVAYAGVIDVKSASSVVVLVFIDQTTTSTKTTAPRIDRNRVRVDLHKVGGHWRVTALIPL
jgi:Mce-associated membrane protein